jgi:omega-6 fatty acid desaturase (delta-12 desaturase)
MVTHLLVIDIYVGKQPGSHGISLFEPVSWGIIVPFIVWNWLMGFVTYQHHTHPEIPWFNDLEEWSASRAQLTCTAHMVFPAIVDLVLLRIMNHTAHHLDPTIPLYRLRWGQSSLGEYAREYRWSLSGCLESFRFCKLYDYDQHQWLDFHGRPRATTRRLTGWQRSSAARTDGQ